jgi:hypothetical protein
MRFTGKRCIAALAGFILFGAICPIRVQEAPARTVTKLWVDEKTGQVFIRPGRGRVPLKLVGAPDSQAIEREVEQRTREQVRSAIAENQAQQQLRQA